MNTVQETPVILTTVEVKTYKTKATCPKCSAGEQIAFGDTFKVGTTSHVWHKCDNPACQHRITLSEKYPKIAYEEVRPQFKGATL